MKLRCLARRYSVLEAVMAAMPSDAFTSPKGSIQVNSIHEPRKLIWVEISKPIEERIKSTGKLTSRVSC